MSESDFAAPTGKCPDFEFREEAHALTSLAQEYNHARIQAAHYRLYGWYLSALAHGAAAEGKSVDDRRIARDEARLRLGYYDNELEGAKWSARAAGIAFGAEVKGEGDDFSE